MFGREVSTECHDYGAYGSPVGATKAQLSQSYIETVSLEWRNTAIVLQQNTAVFERTFLRSLSDVEHNV